MQKVKKALKIFLIVTAVLYCLLLIPEKESRPVSVPAGKPFAWDLNSFWEQLENNYVEARKGKKTAIDSVINNLFEKQQVLFNSFTSQNISANDTRLDSITSNYFQLAALVAARPEYRLPLLNYYNQVRKEIKYQSLNWNLNEIQACNTLYRLLYGMRVATEEVLLQTDSIHFDPVMNVTDEPSVTPSANLFGIKVHSGDLLLSRGGAEVSALISRGNNYPGNFSHVALLYVDNKTRVPYLVEAHIEKGVAVSSAEQYIKDKKLRFMVLRPRFDLPQMKKSGMLPHRAAQAAYDEALSRHIPYDFKMDFYDSSAMFCS